MIIVIIVEWFSDCLSKNTLYAMVVVNNEAWYSKMNLVFHEINCFGRNFDLNFLIDIITSIFVWMLFYARHTVGRNCYN